MSEQKSNEEIAEIFAKLTQPLLPKWRVQSNTPDGRNCIMVPYLDSRQVQQRLDEVVLPQNWSNTFEAESGTASISIFINGEWITKSDVGTDSKVEKEKGKASDAFKRAAVLWGIGRNIYAIGTKLLPNNPEKKRPMTDKGQVLWTGDQQSLYLNGMNTSIGLLNQLWNENKPLQANETFLNSIKTIKELVK